MWQCSGGTSSQSPIRYSQFSWFPSSCLLALLWSVVVLGHFLPLVETWFLLYPGHARVLPCQYRLLPKVNGLGCLVLSWLVVTADSAIGPLLRKVNSDTFFELRFFLLNCVFLFWCAKCIIEFSTLLFWFATRKSKVRKVLLFFTLQTLTENDNSKSTIVDCHRFL